MNVIYYIATLNEFSSTKHGGGAAGPPESDDGGSLVG